MQLVRKFIPPASAGLLLPDGAPAGKFTADPNRRLMLRCSTSNVDRAGDIVEQAGIDVGNFRKNPVVLWQHDYDFPVARALDINLGPTGNLEALCEFPEPGISKTSDAIYNLIRADVIRGVSIGFRPIDSVPLDVGNPVKGPKRIKRLELFEVSLVTIPCNTDCSVLWKSAENGERAHRRAAVEELRKADPTYAALKRRLAEVQRLKVAT